jgi:CheY-like chemotaxis protein
MTETQYKVLVVDDLPDWRKTLGGLLSDAGYNVQAAESSISALRLLQDNEFALAVVDLRLDESNEDDEGGFDLAAQIKQRWPNVKVIIITGYGTPDRIRRAIEPDKTTRQTLVDDYIPKRDTDKLVSMVKKFLA